MAEFSGQPNSQKLIFICCLPSPCATLGHCRGGSITNPMSITTSFRLKSHQEPCDEVGFLSWNNYPARLGPAKSVSDLMPEPSELLNPTLTCPFCQWLSKIIPFSKMKLISDFRKNKNVHVLAFNYYQGIIISFLHLVWAGATYMW